MATIQSKSVRRPLIWGIIAVVAAGVGLGAFAFGPNKVLALIHWAESAAKQPDPMKSADSTNEGDIPSESLEVSPRVIKLNDIHTEVATPPTRPRLLEMRGTVSYDLGRLIHVRARFPGQVFEIATVEEPSNGSTDSTGIRRPLRQMDHVKKGQRLAVLKSKEIGEKKSELAAALAKLRLDRVNLEAARKALRGNAISERTFREFEQKVEVGEVDVERAERTLQAWLLTEEEIDAVKSESEKIHLSGGKIGNTDINWARVEVLAPSDGTILEKNINEGDFMDTGEELFKIADLTQLTAWAHVYEEDLAILKSMPQPIEWKLRVNADPSVGDIVGRIDWFGGMIDPNEHMGLLAGSVPNPNGILAVGQFITATVVLPQETGVVEIPTRALVEDGEESIVLVQHDPSQTDPSQPRKFTKRRVSVARRYHDIVYVRSQLNPQQQKAGFEELHDGERVVATSALELKAILSEQRESQNKSQRPSKH